MKQNQGTVERLKKHDESALVEIMDKYTPLVSSIIYNIGRGTLSAEDIEETAMDTFITLWKNSEKVSENTLKGYICSIAKTKALDKLDTVKEGLMLDIDELETQDDFSLEGSIEEKDVSAVLGQIIGGIDQPDREIVIRYYFYYQKVSVIAEKMQINPETVKVKLHRSRAKIKKILTERGYTL